jgi:hypothetical protein
MAVGKIRAGTAGDPDKLKRELKESSNNDKWFYRLQPDTEIVCRFMTEPWDFVSYMQHSEGSGKNFRAWPCNDGDCVGCDEGIDSRKVWVAPVLDVKESRVRAMAVPKGVVDSLVKIAERGGTIRDRDITVIREGSGMENTKYEIYSDSRKRRDMSIYEPPDIMEMLEEQLEEAMADDDDDDDDPPPRKRSANKSSKRVAKSAGTKRKRERAPWDEDEDEEEERPRRSTGAARSSVSKKAVKKSSSLRRSTDSKSKGKTGRGLRRR